MSWKCCRFDSVWSSRHESSSLLSICRTRSWFAWDKKYSTTGLCRVGWKCSRFDSMRSSRHELSPLLSSGHTESRFAWDLENIVHLGYAGCVENVGDWTRFDQVDTNRCPCCRLVIPKVDLHENVVDLTWFDRINANRLLRCQLLYRKSICVSVRKYSTSGLWGWVGNFVDSARFDRTDTNRLSCCRIVIPSPLMSECHAGKRFAWDLKNIAHLCYSGWAEIVSIRLDSIESTQIAPLMSNSHPWIRFARGLENIAHLGY